MLAETLEDKALSLQNQFTDYDGSIIIGIVEPPGKEVSFAVFYSDDSPKNHINTWYMHKIEYLNMDKFNSTPHMRVA